MKKCLAFAFLFISTSASAEWLRSAAGSDGTIVFTDPETIRVHGNTAQVWVKMDFSKVKTIKARSSTELWKFNCKLQSSFTTSKIVYAPNGQILSSISPEEFDFNYEPVAPDTVGATIMNLICNIKSDDGFDPSKPFTVENVN